MKKGNGKLIFFYIAFALVIIVLGNFLLGNSSTSSEINYSQVILKFQNNEIRQFYLANDNMLFLSDTEATDDGFQYVHELASATIFYEDLNETIFEQTANGTLTEYNYEPIEQISWWVQLLPYLLILVFFGVMWWLFISRSSKNGSGGGIGRMNSFSRARTKLGSDEKVKVYFNDVAGADEEKEELEEVVEFLKSPDKFSRLGARIPKGVLLVGPPGTGKTLLAKAVAGESGVPFYSISGSDFVEMYVGVGASRVRDLFENAKKTAPCIIFIDEIDAVGRHRGAGLGGGHDEREQTLNQLLVEMDGFGVNDGVIVIAATNRPDILDPALLRPGRFDRQVTVNLPDIKGREEILKVHSRGKPLGSDVSLTTVAKSTAGFSGADLANLLNEAALLAARKKKTVINADDIEEATIKIIVGPQKKSRVIDEDEKLKTAYHEAGHAIISRELDSLDSVHQISVIPSGRALGYTLALPENEKLNIYKNEILDKICMLLGGRAAEQIMLSDISGGASNDMERATDLARTMITKLGMSDKLGPIVYGGSNNEVFLGRDFSSSKNYSEEVAALIDKEIYDTVISCYNRALEILNNNIDKIKFIGEYLVKNEVMDAEQFELCFAEGVTFEMLDAVTERKKSENAQENEKRRLELEEKEKAKSDSDEQSEAHEINDGENVLSEPDSTDGGDDFTDDILS